MPLPFFTNDDAAQPKACSRGFGAVGTDCAPKRLKKGLKGANGTYVILNKGHRINITTASIDICKHGMS